jgi:hypothetical protein
MKDTTARDMLEKVTHEPETYAQHHQDLVLKMERVLWIADISQERVKLSTQEKEIYQYYISRTAVLVVMPDPRTPEFPGEIVSYSGLLLATAVHSAAREMMKRIIAWFWNTKFKNSSYKLIPRVIFATENVTATHAAIAIAPSRVQGTNKVLIHTTGAHLLHADCLLRDVEKDRRIL